MTDGIVIFLIGQVIAIATTFITMYTRVTIHLRELDIRVKMVEAQDGAIGKKLDHITEKVNEIFIELQNKQDRK